MKRPPSGGLSRRSFLHGGVAVAGGLLLPPLRVPSPAHATPAPPVELRPGKGLASLLGKGLPRTEIWGYGGQVPGPVLRLRQGETLSATLVNDLPQPTTVHWHGLRIDNKMDGVAKLTQAAVAPGQRFHYRFTVPDAGTFWYHPHNRSWDQMARGLYGLLIVEERTPPQVDRDLAFAIDDWYLKSDASFDADSLGQLGEWAHGGRTGNVLTVNGRPEARLSVARFERLRLRLANTANARILQLRLQGGEAWTIAVDGQPVAQPRRLRNGHLILPPAGRVDLMLDITGTPGSQVVIAEVSDIRLPLIRFDIDRKAAKRAGPRQDSMKLPPNPIPEPDLANALTFTLDMTGGAMGGMRSAIYKGREMDLRELAAKHNLIWAFNGVAGMPDKPFFSVRKGQTVVVKMLNNTAWPHAMHFHGHHVRVLKHIRETRAGRRELAVTKDWRDSVLLERGEEMQVAFVADNPGKWMLHCHMLEHQAGGMMTWFEVIA